MAELPDIEIMIDSASRPFLLRKTLPTIIKYLKYNGSLKWIFHEAFLYSDFSCECIDIANEAKIFNRVYEEKNPKGQGNSITNILSSCRASYFIHWEDDHIGLRDINLDAMVQIMEDNSDVNQIAFNKRDTMSEVSGWTKKVVKRSNYTLTTSPHWRYTPAIWRVEYIKKKWVRWEGNNSHWQINALLKELPLPGSAPVVRSPDWIIEKIGTYYYGGIDEKAFVKHIGSGYSNRVKGT